MVTYNFCLILAYVTGFINKQNLFFIEYLLLENKILRSKIPGRVPLTDSERRDLAIAGKQVGIQKLSEFSLIVKPETLLKWWRILVKQKFDFSHLRKKWGRPRVLKTIRSWIVTLSLENPQWGYGKIFGALKNMGMFSSSTTIKRVLKENHLNPYPGKKESRKWHRFIRSHLDVLWATDFFTYEVCTLLGPVTFYILLFIQIKTRKVKIGGITTNPDATWMRQIARNLTQPGESFLTGCQKLILDGDRKFTDQFKAYLRDFGIEPVKTSPYSPDLNAFAERFIRSIRNECLNHMILWNWSSLNHAVREYVEFYNHERPHQGIESCLIDPKTKVIEFGSIRSKSRLGGLLNFYYTEAA